MRTGRLKAPGWLPVLLSLALLSRPASEAGATASGLRTPRVATGKAGRIPFSFIYDGRSSDEILAGWPATESKERLDAARTRTTRRFTDPKTSLEVRAVVVEYADFPGIVDGTVYFRNGGRTETPILEEVRALDIGVENPSGGAFRLHHIRGSQAREDDFEPLETALGPNERRRFAPVGGRPTDGAMGYFNLELTGDSGLIIGIGWPGQWAAEFVCGADRSLRVTCGQEVVRLCLRPGEEIRTPLVALQAWKGDDWLAAQNVWRRWMVAHNMPHPGGRPLAPQFGGCYGNIRCEAAQEIAVIDGYIRDGIKPDHWIVDAGWYPIQGTAWWTVGDWEVDRTRFPKGLREVADHAHKNGIDFIVWFEPERVWPRSRLARSHPDWILKGRDNDLLDLGNPAAWMWIVNYIDLMLWTGGIDHLRSDFNMSPLDNWRTHDAPDRQGMTENLYVQGFLGFWDELLRRHPAMSIDTCASGGRRIDLETLRRSVPLLRSDFPLGDFTIRSAIGQQGQTFGLSLWVPYHGTGAPNSDAYTLRSSYGPAYRIGYDALDPERNRDLFVKTVAEFRRILPAFLADYYPLTPYSLGRGDWLAWQYDAPEKGKGVVQAFRREACRAGSMTFRLRGLDPEAEYLVTDMDGGAPREASGRSLKTAGLEVAIADAPGSALIIYEKKR
jgi:alpha-galactosidase